MPRAGSLAAAHSAFKSGSRPSTICERRACTRVARVSAKLSASSTALHRALQPATRREAGNARGGYLDALARARVDTLARAALAHAELSKPRHRHLTATAQRVLYGCQHRVHRPRRILLGQIGAIRHLVDQDRKSTRLNSSHL